MSQTKTCFFLLLLSLLPMGLLAQVAPEKMSGSLLKESCKAVLGTENEISWNRKAITPQQKDRLKATLNSRSNIPDTLYVGSARVKGEQYWILPNSAPSKSELFSYVLYLNSQKEIKDVDILEYRESYGYEIDYPFFREQFHGISQPGKIKFRRSIQNISGATISARSITYSVKNLLTVVQIVGLE